EIMSDVNINIQCECHHRRGLLYVARPWAWGRPCRRCRRMMSRSVIVVPTTATAVARPVATTTTTQLQVQQQQQFQQQQTASALPPKYDQAVAAQ
ncbi:hypothetical protein KR018_008436, partial [Drosophila ironensis]